MTRTIEEIKHVLDEMKRTYTLYQDGMNEGGDGFNPHSAALQTLQAAYDAACEAQVCARLEALRADKDAAWTREVTMQRRADWNAWVQRQGRTLHPAQVAAHCQEVGYDNLTLAQQIKRHGL